eukprot:4566224-Alexandrium_andersonii.AAC.1
MAGGLIKVEEGDWRAKKDSSLGPTERAGSATFFEGEPSAPGGSGSNKGVDAGSEPVVVEPPRAWATRSGAAF